MGYPFPPELQELVQEGLASGSYSSEDNLLLEAVHLLRERDLHEQAFHAQLQTRLDRLDRGGGIALEDEAALRKFFDDVQSRGSSGMTSVTADHEPIYTRPRGAE